MTQILMREVWDHLRRELYASSSRVNHLMMMMMVLVVVVGVGVRGLWWRRGWRGEQGKEVGKKKEEW